MTSFSTLHSNYVDKIITAHVCYFLSLAITVMFNQTTYGVDEDDGPAQPILVFSNPSATTFTVQVISGGGSATGEYCSILIN